MKKRLGWIALDIDGTLTNDKYSIPKEVCLYLRSLAESSWQIMLVTGRTFSFASKAVAGLQFPYYFAVQNGSIALEMPSKRIISKNYITGDLISYIDKAYEGEEGDYLIYSGLEKKDFCYWRPYKYKEEDLNYIEDLKSRQLENWHALDDFNSVHIQEFSLAKGFGPLEKMQRIQEKIAAYNLFETAIIKDPFTSGYYILHITNKGANKGSVLKNLYDELSQNVPIIAAGDDSNDVSMLAVADQKIVMPSAPQNVKDMATIIAPPVENMGIIRALDIAIANVSI
ncbi:MAG: hypothetical protein COT84_07250 [Chlamydiae bacterium CG10_big_fil_rev_8_21_14_0_10_35_9]|nr:MAG: hypothetical protein COT84_07250 [Chlamydiae bacterium CG10_big_fil_rev_8_21_14_0_10_35_9]